MPAPDSMLMVGLPLLIIADAVSVHSKGTKCCPTDFTEQYFYDHPDKYSQHPPAFLSQTSLQDENADLCAASHYHETLLKHGVHSESVETVCCACRDQETARERARVFPCVRA